MFKTYIFGEGVSKNARSPIIWNTISSLFSINSKMTCLDTTEGNFESLLMNVVQEEFFIGGLLGSPLKSHKALATLKKDHLSEASNSVNCIFREDAIWCGTTFDGDGALKAILAEVNPLNFKNVFILGSGPVARAINKSLDNWDLNNKLNIEIVSRRMQAADKSSEVKIYSYNHFYQNIKSNNLIINATKLGSPSYNDTPVNYTEFLLAGKGSYYFDVNYGITLPLGTQIAHEIGIGCSDGKMMNLYQAILGYLQVHKSISIKLDFDLIFEQLSTCDI